MFFPRDYFVSAVTPLFSLSCGIKSCGYAPPVIEVRHGRRRMGKGFFPLWLALQRSSGIFGFF